MGQKSADVIIIGGGIIGTAIAYFLSCRKVKVTLLEKADLTSGSSGACDGALFMQTKKPGVHLKLALESIAMLNELQYQLPVSPGYEKSGGLIVIETDKEMDLMERHVKAQRQSGFDVSILNQQELRELSPNLSNHLIGASYSPVDGKINPIDLTLGFALGAKRNGAQILTGKEVTDIEVKNGHVRSVTTTTDKIHTRIIVNATGIYAPMIGKMIGVEIPIQPRRGQLMVTEERPEILKPCLATANYITAKFSSKKSKMVSGGVTIDQTHNGNLLLGSTREFVGYDNSTTIEALKTIAARACDVLPCLTKLQLIRAFAGLRPFTQDGLPILGKIKAVKGMIMAAGHEGDGIALSAITGKLISQLIIEDNTEIPIDCFQLERFQQNNKQVA